MHINSMPDLVLRRVFSKVPLQDLLNAGRVCSLWKYYQMETGKQVRSLALLIGPTDTQSLITNSCFTLKYRDLLLNEDGIRMHNSSNNLHQFFHLNFCLFTLDGSVQLSNIFPHITTLEIAIKVVSGQHLLSPMVSLLTKWAFILKSLKLYFQFKDAWFIYQHMSEMFNETNEFPRLLEVINSLQSLEHLTLDTDTCVNLLPQEFVDPFQPRLISYPGQVRVRNTMDLPVLGRLREFYFNSSNDLNFIEKSLQCYAVPNENLKQIGLHYAIRTNNYPRFPQLTRKIVFLPFNVSTINSTQAREILPFLSITKLRLETESIYGNFAILSNGALNAISSLQQLSHFDLSYYPGLLPSSRTSPELLPQLASVLVLTIRATLKSNSLFESHHWAHLFPNVQVIELAISKICSLETEQTLWYLSKQELHKILSPFVQCPKLHHIYTSEKYSEVQGTEHLLTGLLKEWILLQVHNRKIIIQFEK